MSCVLRLKRRDAYTKLYYILWAIYSFTYIFMMNTEIRYMYSNITNIYNTIQKGLILLVLLLLASQLKLSKKNVAIYVMILTIAVISYAVVKETYFIGMLCFLLPLYKINIEDFLSFDVKIRIITVCIIVGLCIIGIFPNYTATINGAYKQAFGFSHPNTLSAYVISILVEWIAIRYNKLKVRDYVAVLAVLALVWNVAASRSSVYVFLVFFALIFLAKNISALPRNKILQNILSITTSIMALLGFIVVRMYANGNAFIIALDEIFSRRIKAAYRAFSVYGLSVFGQNMETYGARNIESMNTQLYSVDMGYVYIAMHYGVVALLLILVAYYIASKKLIQEKQYGMVLAMTYYAINGIAETYIAKIQFNFTLVIAMGIIMQGAAGYIKDRKNLSVNSVRSKTDF